MEKRNTIQKELVLNAVIGMHRHVTADEVYESIKSQHPTIGKGTIYRNLNILADEHKIRRVEIPEGPDWFDYRCENHYHVRCIRCGAIFDVDMDEITGLKDKIHDTHGMVFLDYDILFKGICQECQKKEKQLKRMEEKNNGKQV